MVPLGLDTAAWPKVNQEEKPINTTNKRRVNFDENKLLFGEFLIILNEYFIKSRYKKTIDKLVINP